MHSEIEKKTTTSFVTHKIVFLFLIHKFLGKVSCIITIIKWNAFIKIPFTMEK